MSKRNRDSDEEHERKVKPKTTHQLSPQFQTEMTDFATNMKDLLANVAACVSSEKQKEIDALKLENEALKRENEATLKVLKELELLGKKLNYDLGEKNSELAAKLDLVLLALERGRQRSAKAENELAQVKQENEALRKQLTCAKSRV